MPLLSTLSYSALSGLGGFYIGGALKNRRDPGDSDEFRDEVMAEINERYEAYLELEARVTRAIKQFDLEEERSAREIHQKEQRILELERALECSVDQAQSSGGASGILDEIEGALDVLDDSVVGEIDDEGTRVELERELEALRAELAQTREEKDAEIQRQEEMIGSLSTCVANLEAELETASTQVASTLETSLASVVGPGDDGTAGVLDEVFGPDVEEEAASLSSDVARAFAEFDASHAGGETVEHPGAEELGKLRARVEELSPYVQRLEDAQARIDGLEQRCEELRASRESAVVELQGRVAELEAEQAVHTESSQERDELKDKVAELAPYVDLLAETRFRVRELEEQCDDVRRTREEDVFGLQARIAELEAERTTEAEGQLEREELQRQVAELSPFVERLEDAKARIAQLEQECEDVRHSREEDVFALQARVAELEAHEGQGADSEELGRQVEELREQLAESQAQLVDSQQLLSESHGELAETKRELSESEDKVFKLEQRCETVRKKKDEQLEVLRDRVSELELLREELDEKDAALGEMEDRCTSLERSKQRASTTMRKLRDELAETEDMVREVGGDPEALRVERAERQALILSVFDELDEVLEGMKTQEHRLAGLDKVYEGALREQEQQVSGLEDRVQELYLLLETAESVIAKLESRD